MLWSFTLMMWLFWNYWSKCSLSVMKWFWSCQFRIILTRTWIAILEPCFLYNLYFEWHFSLVYDLIQMRSEPLKSERCRHWWNASLWLGGIVLPRTRIYIFLIFESFDCVSWPVNDMHTLIMKRISRVLNVVTSRTVLFLNNRAINDDWMIHFRVIWIRKNDSHKLFVASDWIYLSLVVCVLNSSYLWFRSTHHLLVSLPGFLRLFMPFWHIIINGYLHINWFFLFLRIILCFESFHFRAEATGHSHSLIFVYLFCIFGFVCAWTSVGGKDIELCLLKGRTIEGCWVLVYLSFRRTILSGARNCFFCLKEIFLLRLSEDKGHGYCV